MTPIFSMYSNTGVHQVPCSVFHASQLSRHMVEPYVVLAIYHWLSRTNHGTLDQIFKLKVYSALTIATLHSHMVKL